MTTELGLMSHPAMRKMLATEGVEVVVFAETAVRRWLRVRLPDGQRLVVAVPTSM